ncbi:MAG: HU family DNA-binding protein [Bacilli bacterium]
MNKKEFIEAMASKTDSSKVETTKYVDAFLETVSDALESGDGVTFVGFGSFVVRERGERTSRNPRTGETIKVPATKLPAFKVGSRLKNVVKGK